MNTTETPHLTADDAAIGNTPQDDFGINVGEQVAEKMESLAYTPRADDRFPARRDTGACNVGRTEQKFRIGAGTSLLAVAAFAPLSRGWRIGLAAAGLAQLLTGTTRHCPVSQMLGINTCKAGER